MPRFRHADSPGGMAGVACWAISGDYNYAGDAVLKDVITVLLRQLGTARDNSKRR